MSTVYQDAYPIKFKAMAMVDAPFLVWYAYYIYIYTYKSNYILLFIEIEV